MSHRGSDNKRLLAVFPPTCECVFHFFYPLQHHPGVVLSDARRALVICASML